MWLTASDGVRLYAVESGEGATAVVLAHQGGSDLCGWLPYMATLNDAGIRTVAFDFRGWGRSDHPSDDALALGRDLEAAAARARADGATRVFLMGASMGGAAVVQNSASIDVDGRISLSGTRLRSGFGINDPKSVAGLRGPFLYLGSRDDFRAPSQEVLQVFAMVGSHDKQKVLYPGSQHGWDLVEFSSHASQTRAVILRWIRGHS